MIIILKIGGKIEKEIKAKKRQVMQNAIAHHWQSGALSLYRA